MPSVVQQTVRVRGYADINRAFTKADKAAKKEFQSALRDVAEPIRQDAEQRAKGKIKKIGPRWGLMRTGVTSRVVYVAPRERGRLTRMQPQRARPNIAGLLVDRAMQPALDAHAGEVERRFDEALATVERVWDR